MAAVAAVATAYCCWKARWEGGVLQWAGRGSTEAWRCTGGGVAVLAGGAAGPAGWPKPAAPTVYARTFTTFAAAQQVVESATCASALSSRLRHPLARVCVLVGLEAFNYDEIIVA